MSKDDTHITPVTEESDSQSISINKSSQSLEERMFWEQQEEMDSEDQTEQSEEKQEVNSDEDDSNQESEEDGDDP